MINDTIVLVTSSLTLVTAFISLVLGIKNKKAIQEVHVSLNSRLTQLLQKTEESAHAAGKAEGKIEK